MTGPFYNFLHRLRFGRVTQWVENKDYSGRATIEPAVTSLEQADVIQSIRREGNHALLLDIDYPVYLAQSTNGNSHLYMDVPDGLSTVALKEILEVLGKHGVIEEGYAGASIRRGYTSLRRPGRRKGRPIPYCGGCGRRGDQIPEYRNSVVGSDIQDIEDFIYREEGTIEKFTGLFTCTDCHIKQGMPLNGDLF